MTGSGYLEGFIGDGVAEKSCLAEKVEVWAEELGTLAGLTCKHLQYAYARLQESL